VTFLADIDSEIVGLVGAYRDATALQRVHLVSMWVAPAARRQGNAAAEELYRVAGFSPTGEVQALPSDPMRKEMELTLSVG